MPGEKRTAAFFDFDKTLLRVESADVGFKYLWKQGMVSSLFLLRLAAFNQLYKRNLYSSEKMADLCLTYYRGKKLREFINGAREFYLESLKPNLSPAVLAEVERHRREGRSLVILSASVLYMLSEVAKDLGFDHVLCTRLETDADGLCTGRTVGPVMLGENKKIAAEDFAARENVDLSGSWAYSDNHSDIPLLECVGHAVAVQPTAILRLTAEMRGWRIIEKD